MTVAPPKNASLHESLNPAQREAVLHSEGPLLVLAGAGSGKTRVLTARIANLIQKHDVSPASILAVTFTNKAAGEMRERIARLLGEEPSGMWCGTFHAIGARMIRAHAHLVGRTSRFTIYDEDDTLGAIKRVMERLRISHRDFAPQAIAASISDARNALVSPQEFESLAQDKFSKAVASVYSELGPAMRQANAVSFDELLTLPVEILGHDEVKSAYRRRFTHILIDEYQDTNRAQYMLAVLLGGGHGNVMVVGDDDQSIYGWRGADIRNILDFEKDFPQARVVRLEENYRSTPGILALANAAISANTERRGKTLRASRAAGEPVTVLAALDDRDEADSVIDEIQKRRYASSGRSLKDFAILYRTNAQSRSFEEALRRASLPYRLVGAVRFYDRREIRDLMAYLKLVANPSDDEAFRRAVSTPRRGIGEATIEQLAAMAHAAHRPIFQILTDAGAISALRPAARQTLAQFHQLVTGLRELARDASVDEILTRLVVSIGYEAHLRSEGPEGEERLENVRELITGAAETVIDEGGEVGLTPLDHFLQQASLVAGADALDKNAEAVTLMTLHNAKGLEFPVVFLTGLEEGLFPLARAMENPSQLEEERRLFYVGVTRAEDVLYVTHARSRRRNGELMQSLPSSFVRGLPRTLYTDRATIRLRGSGRGAADFASRDWRSSSRDTDFDEAVRLTPSARRPGIPVARRSPTPAEDESQDSPSFRKGERVAHKLFGEGTIADVSGAGREAKVTVDFDDEEVGRKRLVIAFAGLSRALD